MTSKILQINLLGKDIEYTLQTSRRAKRMRLSVSCDGRLIATRPRGLSEGLVEGFIVEKADWVLKRMERAKNRKSPLPAEESGDYLKYKENARIFILRRIDWLNETYGFQFNRISVRNQRTRWGSCSSGGNLNFNYRIVLLPEHIADYIIVHELCHLKEMNHSKRFWDLVALAMPEYKKIRKEMREKWMI